MIANRFTALTYQYLNDGTKTFCKTVTQEPEFAVPRVVQTLGGLYNTRANQRSIIRPMRRTVTYSFIGDDEEDANTHIDTLKRTDLGKKGNMIWEIPTHEPQYLFFTQAILEGVGERWIIDEIGQRKMVVTLTIQELTDWEEWSGGGGG